MMNNIEIPITAETARTQTKNARDKAKRLQKSVDLLTNKIQESINNGHYSASVIVDTLDREKMVPVLRANGFKVFVENVPVTQDLVIVSWDE